MEKLFIWRYPIRFRMGTCWSMSWTDIYINWSWFPSAYFGFSFCNLGNLRLWRFKTKTSTL